LSVPKPYLWRKKKEKGNFEKYLKTFFLGSKKKFKGLFTLAMFYGDNACNSDTRQSLLTCSGHLGQSDINRIDPIPVMPPAQGGQDK
jgi:hypothetical protein